MPPRSRSYDPAKVRSALQAEITAIGDAVRVLCSAPDAGPLLEAPDRTGKSTVRRLVTGLVEALDAAARVLDEARPGRPTTGVRDGVHALSAIGALPAPGEPPSAGAPAGPGPQELRGLFDAAAERFRSALEKADSAAVVPAGSGTMTVADFLTTRVLELLVRVDDVTLATGTAVAHDRQALATAVRLTADALATAVPGGAVEVRIAPFAVIQCIEGPRHTRGTPPNVVEASPLVWIRLATGRLSWTGTLAAGEVVASGQRADLSDVLPLNVQGLGSPPAASP